MADQELPVGGSPAPGANAPVAGAADGKPAVIPPVADPKVAAPDAKPDDKKPEADKAPEPRKTLEQKLADKKAADAKPEDKKDGKPDEKKPDAKAGEIAIKLPEGAKVDDKALAKFKEVSQTLGLKSEGAQTLFDMYNSMQTELAKSAQAETEAQQDKWENEILSWANPEEELGLAKVAVNKLADDEAKAFFSDTFVGSNPNIVKFLANVGRLLKEAPLHESGDTAKKEFTALDLFPLSAKK